MLTGGSFMGSSAIIAAIDKELAKLHDVRARLLKKEKTANARKNSKSSSAAKKKAARQLSPAARERIAEAQRKRWAAARKAKKH
jgi:hypothetical protein